MDNKEDKNIINSNNKNVDIGNDISILMRMRKYLSFFRESQFQI